MGSGGAKWLAASGEVQSPDPMLVAHEVDPLLERQCLPVQSQQNQSDSGGDDGTRTRGLMRGRQHRLGYLVDFAARLATQEHARARQEH